MFHLTRFLITLGLGLGLLPGQVVPGRYIVELEGAPAATRRGALRARRAEVQAEQRRMRPRVEQTEAQVVTTLDTVVNGMVVEIDDAKAQRLGSLPGVVKVHRVHEVKALLDHAVPLHKAPDAWSLIGGADNAGAGVKIGIVDTGIDPDHPAFQDPALKAPEGYPKVSRDQDLPLTSGKIIVARSYESLFRSPDSGPRDRNGHGSAVAMAAAGVTNTGPIGAITGMAPKAYLGVYRISRANTGSSRTDVILKAIDDAVADGMDVINVSFGDDLARRPADDPEVAAIERAAARGVIVVVAGGNNGPDPSTIASPATAPSAISVGASWNDRAFGSSVTLDTGRSYLSLPGNGSQQSAPISAPLVEAPGLTCDPLPAKSLSGAVALILRGTCLFETKLMNAQNAGAVAAIVRTDQARPDPVIMSVGQATLPAVMVSYSDGVELSQRLASGASAQVQVDFRVHAVSVDAARVFAFSSRGPSVDGALKPDLLAAGVEIYTATQRSDRGGDLYDASGYVIVDGTSLSSPIVAGAAAVLKGARPGLTVEQYRSLLINTATGVDARVQDTGGGMLNLLAAVQGTVAAYPTSLSFGAGSGEPDISRGLTISNLGATTDTYVITVEPRVSGPGPLLSTDTIDVAPGASVNITARFWALGLTPGEYHGFLRIRGTANGVDARVPYWYGATSRVPNYLTVLNSDESGRSGLIAEDAIILRISDRAGVPILGLTPNVTVISGGGSVVDVHSLDVDIPGAYGITLRMGLTPGDNVFQIQAGDLVKQITITGT